MIDLVFGGAVAVLTAAVALAVRRRPAVAAADADEPAPPRLAGLAPGLAESVPFSDTGRAELRATLAAAGEYRAGGADGFVAHQVLLAGGAVVAAQVVGVWTPDEWQGAVAVGGAVAAAVGYFLPRAWLSARARRRREAVAAGLPLALDLLAVGLDAGADIRGGLDQVGRAVRRASPVLADELAIVGRQADLYTLGHAVRLWADRGGVPEVRDLARLVEEAEAVGAGVSGAVATAAAELRAAAKLRAEARANRLGFWLLLPTMGCFLTAAAVLMLAPAVVQLADYRSPAGPRPDWSARQAPDSGRAGR